MPDHRTTTERVASFSDAVIAVIITIMVLDLKAPDSSTFAAIIPLWPTIVSYIVSYLFIAIIWVNHHYLLRFVRFASPRLIWINFAHLFVVSLIPFATAWMAQTRLAPAPVAVYAAIFVLVNIAYLVFEHEVMSQADTSEIPEHARRFARQRSLVGLAIFSVATLTAPFVPLLGFGLICLALILYLRPEALSSPKKRRRN